MEDIINLLYKNKEWLFSGIGVTAIVFFFSLFKTGKQLNINVYPNQTTPENISSLSENSKSKRLNKKYILIFLFALSITIIIAISLNPSKDLHFKKLSEFESNLYTQDSKITYKNHIIYSEMILDSNDNKVLTKGYLGKVYRMQTLSQFEVFTYIRKYLSDIDVQQGMFGFDSLKSIMEGFYSLKDNLDYENHELVVALSKAIEDIAFILYTTENIKNKSFAKDSYFSKDSSNSRIISLAQRLNINAIEIQTYSLRWDKTIQEQIERIFINDENYFSDSAAKKEGNKNANN